MFAHRLLQRTLATLACLIGAASAAAGVTEVLRQHDLRSLGDALVTVDTVDGRQWLDLTESIGLSYLDLAGPSFGCRPTCRSGRLAGWTLASEADVLALFTHVGFIDPATGRSFEYDSPPANPAADDIWRFTHTLGLTFVLCQGPCWTLGDTRNDDQNTTDDYLTEGLTSTLSPDRTEVVLAQALWGAAGAGFASVGSLSLGTAGMVQAVDLRSARAGAWLYRIPEPPVGLLVVVALVVAGALGVTAAHARPRRPEGVGVPHWHRLFGWRGRTMLAALVLASMGAAHAAPTYRYVVAGELDDGASFAGHFDIDAGALDFSIGFFGDLAAWDLTVAGGSSTLGPHVYTSVGAHDRGLWREAGCACYELVFLTLDDITHDARVFEIRAFLNSGFAREDLGAGGETSTANQVGCAVDPIPGIEMRCLSSGTVQRVPEPATAALGLLGLLLMARAGAARNGRERVSRA